MRNREFFEKEIRSILYVLGARKNDIENIDYDAGKMSGYAWTLFGYIDFAVPSIERGKLYLAFDNKYDREEAKSIIEDYFVDVNTFYREIESAGAKIYVLGLEYMN